ncbi:MAG: substrate-binding domain-containing protein [Verrucomicrobiota bacterium]
MEIQHPSLPNRPSVLDRIRTVLVLTSTIQRFPGIDPEAANTPNQRILQGISEAAIKRRVSAPIQFVNSALAEKLSDPQSRPLALQQGQVDGMIVVSSYAEEILKALGNLLPFVVIPSPEKSLRVDSVGPEHIHGVEMLVRYLYQLGHNRIGYVSLRERSPWSHDRFTGYLYALNKLGLQFRPGDILNMFGPSLSDRKLMDPVVKLTREGVTAWVCASDGLAAQVHRALTRNGFKVPSQVSITGFDGVEVFQDCPQITTIAVPWYAMGAGALIALLERIEHPDQATSHRAYNGTFVKGATSGSPPKSQPKRGA